MASGKSRKTTNTGQRNFLIGLLGLVVVIVTIAIVLDMLKPKQLPFLGNPVYNTVKTSDGVKTDSIYPVVPPFSFTNQQMQIISNATFKGHAYVADFFFTSCPTICPVMSRNLKKVYDHFGNSSGLMFLSHTIDPKYDTPEVLKNYADKLGVSGNRWHFVTGPKEEIYQLAEHGYYSHAAKDDAEQGGFVHSGALILVDRNGHLRGMYDGTSDEETQKLLDDLDILLGEK